MEQQIYPKSEWPNLNSTQLFQVKNDLEQIYWNLIRMNKRVAENYLQLAREAEYVYNIKIEEEKKEES